jgi:hypothetical protein
LVLLGARGLLPMLDFDLREGFLSSIVIYFIHNLAVIL